MKKALLTTIILVLLNLCTTPTTAQITEYTFTLDEQDSYLQVRGDVYGFKLIGDREAAFGGTFDTRLGNRIEPFRGFIIDDSFIVQLDPLDMDLKNPIPFFPPIGHISITDMTLRITTGIIMLKEDGSFTSNSGSVEVLTGTANGEFLGIPIDPVDLAGAGATNVPLAGDLYQVDDMIALELPLVLELSSDDYNLAFTGGFIATAPVQ